MPTSRDGGSGDDENLSGDARTLVADHRWIVKVVATRHVARGATLAYESLRVVGHRALVESAREFDGENDFRAFAWSRIDVALRGERFRSADPRMVAGDRGVAEFAASSPGAPFEKAASAALCSELCVELWGALAARLLASATAPLLAPTSGRLLELLALARQALRTTDRELLRRRWEEQLDVSELARCATPPKDVRTVARELHVAHCRLGEELRLLTAEDPSK